MEIIILVWFACGILGALIGQSKNQVVLGAILGFALGVIGVLIICVVPVAKKYWLFEIISLKFQQQ